MAHFDHSYDMKQGLQTKSWLSPQRALLLAFPSTFWANEKHPFLSLQIALTLLQPHLMLFWSSLTMLLLIPQAQWIHCCLRAFALSVPSTYNSSPPALWIASLFFSWVLAQMSSCHPVQASSFPVTWSRHPLPQDPANFFCEGPDTKYLQLCEPYNLWQPFSSAVVARMQL